MEIVRITFVETPEYLDQGIRSYETDLKAGMVEDALERSDRGRNLSPVGLSKIATSLVRPTGRFIKSTIDNGWGCKRIRFAMLVSIQERSYSKEYAYITGHTDHADHSILTNDVKFDDDMRLYFNSVTRVNVLESEYRGKSVWQPNVTSHDQVLNRSVFSDQSSTKDKVLMRPNDLYRRRGQSTDMKTTMGGRSGGYQSHFTETTNLVGAFTGQLSANTRSNNSPSSYLSRSVSAYVRAAQQNSEIDYGRFDGDSHDDVLNDAVDRVDENLLDTDPVFDRMKSDTNIMRQGYITFGELLAMSPDFDERRQLGFKPLARSRRERRDEASSMRGDNVESIAANILAQSLPTVMLFSMYSLVENMVINTRARPGEDMVIVPIAMPYMDGFSTASTLDYFIDQMEMTVIPDMTQSGRMDINAKVTADIDGDIEIWIRVDGGPEEYFCYPAFADNLMSPVLSNDSGALERVSSDVLSIAEGFFQGRSSSTPRHLEQAPYREDRDEPSPQRHSRSNSRFDRNNKDW